MSALSPVDGAVDEELARRGPRLDRTGPPAVASRAALRGTDHWIVDDQLPQLMGDAEFPVAVMDEAGRLTWMSSALRSLLGESGTECLLTGSTLYGEFGNVCLKLEDLPLARACKQAEAHEAVVTVTASDGAVRHHHWSARPLFTPTGEHRGAMAVITDITSSVEAARRCLDADLVTTVSHQIRTPLTSILGYAELIQGGVAGPSEVKAATLSILRAGHRLEVVAAWLCGQLGSGASR
jgi:PAS domain S-box-containing protein